MTSRQGRMTGLIAKLTPRERAVLYLRRLLAGEQPDQYISMFMPPSEAAEFKRLVRLVENANDRALGWLAIWQLAVEATDRTLAWLETLLAWEDRCRALEEGLLEVGICVVEAGPGRRPSRGVMLLEPLPRVSHGLAQEAMVVFEGYEAPGRASSASPAELPAVLREIIRQGVEARWQELAGLEVLFTELSEMEFLGQPIVRDDVPHFISEMRERLREIAVGLEAAGGVVTWESPAAPLPFLRRSFGLREAEPTRAAETEGKTLIEEAEEAIAESHAGLERAKSERTGRW